MDLLDSLGKESEIKIRFTRKFRAHQIWGTWLHFSSESLSSYSFRKALKIKTFKISISSIALYWHEALFLTSGSLPNR
jgi:hypothetical protein